MWRVLRFSPKPHYFLFVHAEILSLLSANMALYIFTSSDDLSLVDTLVNCILGIIDSWVAQKCLFLITFYHLKNNAMVTLLHLVHTAADSGTVLMCTSLTTFKRKPNFSNTPLHRNVYYILTFKYNINCHEFIFYVLIALWFDSKSLMQFNLMFSLMLFLASVIFFVYLCLLRSTLYCFFLYEKLIIIFD